MKKSAATAIVGACIGTAVSLTAAPASAAPATPQEQNVAQQCFGLSPYIVDWPYNGGLVVKQKAGETGSASVSWGLNGFGPVSLFGYRTEGTLSWKNLQTGKQGSERVDFAHNLSGPPVSTQVTTGPGLVRFTTKAVNTAGPFKMAAPTCTGVATIR